jgi:urease gamma subunit
MEYARVAHLADILVGCHGAEAENLARKRANRCLRLKEMEWAALWFEVAEQIARQGAPAGGLDNVRSLRS